MRRRCFLAACMVLAADPAAPAASAEDGWQEVFARASAAVVKLYGAGAGCEHGYGTGVLVSSDGRILTTQSLLVAGPSLRVVLADGRRYEGSVLRTDEYRQLALLKIDAQGLPHLTPAPSEHLQIGDAVLGLGNWFKIAEGEEPVSLTRGIVSLKTNLDARRLAQDVQYGGPVLVFDAITANPGAAGGPILDAQGRFVGLIGKIVEAAATNTRLNYALPAEELTAFLRADDPPAASAPGESAPPPTAGLPKRQPAARPYVGIKLSSLGYRHVAAFVERVRPDSPAALAGIKPDDLIVAIDGQRVADAQAYRQIIERTMPGQTVQFTIKRGQEVFNVAVTIGSEPQ